MFFLLDQKERKNQDDFKLTIPGSNSKIVSASMQEERIELMLLGLFVGGFNNTAAGLIKISYGGEVSREGPGCSCFVFI